MARSEDAGLKPVVQDGAGAWRLVALLFAAYVCSYLDRMILSLMVDPIRHSLHLTDFQFSLLQGPAFVVLYSVLGLPFGWLVDSYSRRRIVALGVLGWTISTASCGLARNFSQLFVARASVGIGEAILSPGAYSLISDAFTKRMLPRALSVYSLGIPVGTGLALMIGGQVVGFVSRSNLSLALPWLGTLRSWQLVFLLVSLPGLLIAWLVSRAREPARLGRLSERAASPSAVLSFMSRRPVLFVCFLLGFAVITAFSHGLAAWTPTFFERLHHWSAAKTGGWLGLEALSCGAAGLYCGGAWAGRLQRAGRTDALMLVPAVACLVAIPFGVAAPLVSDPYMALGLFAVVQFCTMTPWGVASTVIQVIAPNEMRGQLSAVYLSTINLLGLGLGPSLVAGASERLGGPNAIGHALALSAFTLAPLGAFLLLFGLIPLRQAVAKAEAWQGVGTTVQR